MDISSLRKEIDAIDGEIVRLISERTDLAAEIGKLKAEEKIPLRDEKREKEVIAKFREKAEERGLDGDTAEKIAKLLIEQALSKEG